MKQFQYIEDVWEFLDPMDYQGFWYAIEPYDLDLMDRAYCDDQIAQGRGTEACMLDTLKAMAEYELTNRLDLFTRPIVAPWLRVVHSS